MSGAESARNAIIDYYRQRGSAERVSERLVAHVQDRREPDELFKGEICQCGTALLKNVKPEYRDAIQTIDLDDGSLADLATRAGITANNAAVRVHRAREPLRKQVATACGICATHGCIECHCKPKGESGLSARLSANRV
jgi:RNA polymerase sigma-70 factor (ECF subfamily)